MQKSNNLNLIVAVGKNGVIGYKNKMPWYFLEDLKWFKNITSNHSVVMGRKTFESLKKPLVNRKNYILTKNLNYSCPKGTYKITNFKQILSIKNEQIFIIGGEKIYNLFLPYINYIYLTYINKNYSGDTFFCFDEKKFKLFYSKQANTNNLTFKIYKRI